MGAKVFLHIGAPKSGTTYLQDRLFLNRAELARHGIKYPTGMREDMFLAALDLTGIRWPGFHDKAPGEWDALVRRVKLASGTVVISHEILSVARPARIRRVAETLGDHELHLVLTTRDIGRQLVGDWQEGVKMYGTKPFGRFLAETMENDPRTSKQWFWRAQHLPRVLGNWGQIVPPENIHLIVLPRRGGDVWEPFSRVIGARPEWAPQPAERRNSSLGPAEMVLLRRLNRRLKAAGIDRPQHRSLVLNPIVYDTLAERNGTRITLPPDAEGWATSVAKEWAEWVAASGVDVVGDLDDLLPAPRSDDQWHDPDRVGPRAVRDAALDALVGVILEAANRPDPEARITRRAVRAARRLARRGR
jgi:hypothetical protein